ncbi:MAG: transcriptional regulator [Candidatus Thorarchaeota archaeon]|jgi:predicted Zn-ribbon and HTH transcriptional regulator
MTTRRESIALLLEETEHPLSAQEICNILDIKNRSIVQEDLEHIAKSLKNRGKELLMRPATCGKCDYAFDRRVSPKKPSRCPKCRSEWILSPGFIIKQLKK